MSTLNVPSPTAAEVERFRSLYREDQGENLSEEKALGKLIGLLHISVVHLRIEPSEKPAEKNEHQT